MQEYLTRIHTVRQKIDELAKKIDIPALRQERERLGKEAEAPNLWDDREKAQAILKRLNDVQDEINDWENLIKRSRDTQELIELNDESLLAELEPELKALENAADEKEISVLFSGKYDSGNAILAIHAGAGGTEAHDWAAMLQRMYLRWAENHRFTTEIVDFTPGEEAGTKTVTISISGKFAYGYLKSEKGTHRLVRLSPFDAAHRRHTSFAMVEILPEASADDSIEIPPDEIRIDVFKSSGAGGQNVQKNSTAVRLLHIPTGIIVTCQNERSQTQNREGAMKVLRSRLLDLRQQEQNQEIEELRGEYVKAEWGSQIRSYVLHPYQLVKDNRTDYETGNTQAVLNGELDPFMEAYLKRFARPS